MQDLVDDVDVRNVVAFIKETHIWFSRFSFLLNTLDLTHLVLLQHIASFVVMLYLLFVPLTRLTTCLENLEMSGNLTVIGEMSWIFSGGATPGRARSNALAKNILSRLAPWLTEIFTFGHSQSLQLMICLTTVLTCKWPGCLDVLAPPLGILLIIRELSGKKSCQGKVA